MLDDLRKYFIDDAASVGTFLGMKFGFGSKSWQQLHEQICEEVDDNEHWMSGLTLGIVLAEMRRRKSSAGLRDRDKDAERISRLNQPKQRKVKFRK